MLDSGWLTTGKVVDEFEHAFSSMMGGRPCLAVNSATAGIGLALDVYGIGPGDEVISSCWTFSSPVMEVYRRGAKPVLVDVDPLTLNMDPAAVRSAITKHTKAIIVTHFGGEAADMDLLQSIARENGLLIIEDAAHALPTHYDGQLIGTLDTAATVFSFYATKTLTTGEGGMVVLPHDYAKRARQIRLHGIDRNVFDRYRSPSAQWSYDVVDIGLKANMTDMAAAVGVEQLKKVGSFAGDRRYIADEYHLAFSKLPLTLPPSSRDSAWHLYVIRLQQGDHGAFIERMRLRGVGCSVHFIPIHWHSFWAAKMGAIAMPVADQEFPKVVSLPIYPKMQQDDINRVIDAVRECLS